MESRISEAFNTALLNLEDCPKLLSTATSLTQGALDELRDSEDWGLDINDWYEARDKLSVPLKEHLSDDLKNLPDRIVHDMAGEYLRKEIDLDTWNGMSRKAQDEAWKKRATYIERNTWKCLSSSEQDEVWVELADWLLTEVVH